jgi:AcrR family transcriptional regulator
MMKTSVPAATAGPAASPAETAPSAPRRERKKQQTRDALIRAGLDLFRAKGYEHTAVHEITDIVDVAERTFFRYFASKEDLALSFVKDGLQAFTEALRSRPPDEEPLQALRSAFHLTLEQQRARGAGESAYVSTMELIDSTPSLLAAQLRYIHSDDQTARVLAEREHVDPDTDLRPRVLATVFAALISRATRAWRTSGGGGTESLAAAFDLYFGQLGPALAGHWMSPVS